MDKKNFRERRSVKLMFPEGSGRTRQQFRKESDVNHIVKQFSKTGVLPHVQNREGRYGDFSDVPTYQEAMQVVFDAQEQFAGLSADVRKRFHNDPEEFLEFVNDSSNLDEMVKLGLATKPEETRPGDKPTKKVKSSKKDPENPPPSEGD